jgi:EmrB/QacA subfamily drug resistance transporter
MALHTYSAPAGAVQAGRSDTRRWWGLALLCVAQFMLILDVTVVNVALPDIGSDLHLERATLTWVLTAYTLVFGGLMLLGGRAADAFGARPMLMTGLVVFTAASLFSGIAANGPMLLSGRAAQGVGAALLSPAALSVVSTTFEGRDRARALGVWAAIAGAGSAVGVILGGVLTADVGWRWIFLINLPVGVALLAALPSVLPAGRSGRAHDRVDVAGAVTVTAASGAGIYGLINAGNHGWLTPSTYVPLAAAVVLYAGFVAVERMVPAPLMQMRVFVRRPVASGALLMLVATGLLVGGFFLGSFYLQDQRGYSAVATGAAFLPIAVATIIGAHTGSNAVTRLDRRVVTAVALSITAVGAAIAARWIGPVAVVAGLSVAALGLGAALVAATTSALADVDPHEAGVRSGIVNTAHELGAAIGVAALSSVAAASLAVGSLSLTGFTRAFSVSSVAALAAAGLAAMFVPAGKAPEGAMPHGH